MFIVALFLVALLVANAWSIHEMVTPVIVSALFTLAVSVVAGLVWKRIAKNNADQLPTYYTAASGFRLLLALAVMFVYYLIMGRSNMLVFFLVFMVFYLVSLTHHSIFFAKVSNRS